MSVKTHPFALLFSLTITQAAAALADNSAGSGMLGECTIGAFTGSVTMDGRPLIWKNRDVGNEDQRFIYYSAHFRNGVTTLAFTGDCYRIDTTRIYMGANEAGFAILNSDSYNLGDSLSLGLDDGTLMRLALETCRTLPDFERFLDSTNATGRLDCWNFACLDSTAACAIYECANFSYTKYDPQASPSGYILRANYSESGGSNKTGLDRFKRASSLTGQRILRRPIDAGFILEHLARDLGNIFDDPYPLPYLECQSDGPPGYIYNYGITICNRSTASAVVIRGIRTGEPASFTTVFAMIGTPILSVAIPLWVKSGEVPYCLSSSVGAPIYQLCAQRRRQLYDNPQAPLYINSRYLLYDDGGGVYSYTLPLEAWGISEADRNLDYWQFQQQDADQIRDEQNRIAATIFTGFENETAKIIQSPSDPAQLPGQIAMFNYPNPFNRGTMIQYSGASGQYQLTVDIYDLAGKLVTSMDGNQTPEGTVYWSCENSFGDAVSSGIYFYKVSNGPFTSSNKMVFLK